MSDTTPPVPGSAPPSSGSPYPSWSAGPVTRLGTPGHPVAPPPGAPGAGPPPDAVARQRDQQRRMLWWFSGAAGAVLVVGLIVVLAMTLSGNPDPFRRDPSAPTDVRPPLARKCPPPASTAPDDGAAPGAPAPGGARTVDREAGISYKRYGDPWQDWDAVWSAGTLEVPYKVGQHFITEAAYDGVSDYHASILSAAVPAAENDAVSFDLECVGRQVAADVRAEYYPQPNRVEPIRDERTTLGGLPAWVTVFRLHFDRPDLDAKDELAGVACIDVGRPTAAVLYVSIPGTHKHLDWVVADVLDSVRPAA